MVSYLGTTIATAVTINLQRFLDINVIFRCFGCFIALSSIVVGCGINDKSKDSKKHVKVPASVIFAQYKEALTKEKQLVGAILQLSASTIVGTCAISFGIPIYLL